MLQSITNNATHNAGAGTFALVHTSPASPGCSGSTTCSVTLSASMSSNNLATIQCDAANAVSLVSASAGGTIVPVAGTSNGNSNSFFSADGYIYPTSSTAGPIVLTFNGSMGAGTTCLVREYSITSGIPILDWAHSTLRAFAGTTSVAGETPGTFTGTNEIMVQHQNNDQVVTTSVSGGSWAHAVFDGANGPGWADWANTVSTTPPTWNWSGSHTGLADAAGMAFATDATPCKDQGYWDFSGGTNGANPTTVTLGTSTHGYFNYGWAKVGATNPMTFSNSSSQALLNPIRLCGDGVTYPGAAGLHIHYNLSVSAGDHFEWSLPQQQNNVSKAYWYKNDLSTGDTSQFITAMVTTNGGSDFIDLMCNSGTCYIETTTNANGAPDFGAKWSYTANTWFWVSDLFRKYIGGPFTISSVANAAGGNTVYTGTITGGGSNAFLGQRWMMYGHAQAANNGFFTVTASTATTVTLNNPSGVVDTTGHGTPSFHELRVYDTSCTLLSTQGKIAAPGSPNIPTQIWLSAGNDTGTSVNSVDLDKVVIDFNGTTPILCTTP